MLRPWSHCCVAAIALLPACGEDLDVTRKARPSATFGEEVFRVVHRDLVRESEAQANGFALERTPFVRGLDTILPENDLDDAQALLVNLLPLYDNAVIPGGSRAVAQLLSDAASDVALLNAFNRVSRHADGVPPDDAGALSRHLLTAPNAAQLFDAMLELAGHEAFEGLLSGLRRSAPDTNDTPTDRTPYLLAEFLLTTDPVYAEMAPGQGPRMVEVDERGVPQVTSVVAPFADVSPADGKADIDAEGRFIGRDGTHLIVPPFTADGAPSPLYDHLDLGDTMMAGLLREARALTKDIGWMPVLRLLDLTVRGSNGQRDLETSVALDSVHSLGAALDTPTLTQLLLVSRRLLTEQEPGVARVGLELKAVQALADMSQASLRTDATLSNDLLAVSRKLVAKEGLLEDLVVALRSPEVRGLSTSLARLLRYKKDRVRVQDVAANAIFVTEVDRGAPDIRTNQSLAQRMLHLVYDAKGSSYEPNLFGIPLGFIFKIDDVGQFYLQSIIGQAQIPGLVSDLTGLSERPTPEELAVFLNENQPFGNAKGREGIDVRDNDGDAAFALSASGLTTALRPIVRVFNAHGKLPLLLDLMEVAHLHWASTASDYQDQRPNAPRFSRLSGIRAYEPLLVDVLSTTELVDAAFDLLEQTKDLKGDGETTAHAILVAFGRHLLTQDATLLTRAGRGHVEISGQRVSPLSPLDLLRSSFDQLDRMLDATPAVRQDSSQVSDAIATHWLGIERTAPDAGRISNRRVLKMVDATLAFLETRARGHEGRGLRSDWLRRELQSSALTLLDAQRAPAVMELLFVAEGRLQHSSALRAWAAHWFDEPQAFRDLLTLGGGALAIAKDGEAAPRIFRFLDGSLTRDPEWIAKLVRVGSEARRLDTRSLVSELIRRGAQRQGGSSYVGGVASAIAQIHRANPMSTTPLSVGDLRLVLAETASFLLDKQHGLEKLYDFVSKRDGEANR